MKLSIPQRNELFDILTSAGLSAQQFDWEQQGSSGFSQKVVRMRLRRIDREQHFEINQVGVQQDTEYNCTYTPGAKKQTEEHKRIRWGTLLSFFKQWCSALGNDVSGGDKWAEIAKQLESARILTHPMDEQSFTETELLDLHHRLGSLKENLCTISLQPMQGQLVVATLDRVADQAKYLNKFDWKSLFAGTIANLIITLRLPPSIGKAFWDCTKESFDNSFSS